MQAVAANWGNDREVPSELAINLATVREQFGLKEAVEACAALGIRSLGFLTDQMRAVGLPEAVRIAEDNGVRVTGLARGGIFPAALPEGRAQAISDTKRAVDEAAALGAECLIILAGGLPAGTRDLAFAREMVCEGLFAVHQYALLSDIPLALEPLHPMYAADRACLNTLEQALDICDLLGEGTGIAVDTYHTWWDPKLEEQIVRAGKRRLLAYHVSDWLVPTRHLLFDRGMMGDGVIDFCRMRSLLSGMGYEGSHEVEIFSSEWWSRPGELVLRTCLERFIAHCT